MEDKEDKSLEEHKVVQEILMEALKEFRQKYGDKHYEHIRELLENVRPRKDILFYSGNPARAHTQTDIVYTESENLSAMLKHELWHIYSNVGIDKELSLGHIPQRYIEQLRQNGYLESLYTEFIEEVKNDEFIKSMPEIYEKSINMDIDTYINNKFGFREQNEMWTEFFSSQTHKQDMKERFWNWGNGFYTESLSSGSSYDAYTGIASIISDIIPRDKLLEMYLRTVDYKTGYSYPEMLEEFDATYENALNEEEKQKYKYPYLKIMSDIRTIDNNTAKNPQAALEALESCMKTCFNAYLIKLENIKNMDLEQAPKIYSEIKHMQSYMVWNTDISKMQELGYIQSMTKIQDKFRGMLSGLSLENLEVSQMMESVDYTADNPFKFVENGEALSKKIIDMEGTKEDETKLINIGSYGALVGEKGIKDNLETIDRRYT